MPTVDNNTDSRFTVLGGAAIRPEYRCTRCGYGAATNHAPPTCPMCKGETWAYGSGGSGSLINVKRLRGGETYVLTPPRQLDAGSAAMLAEVVRAVAELPEEPQILLDLTRVELLDQDACIDLVERLSTATLEAGGATGVLAAGRSV
jgi:hypothetical protein